jgi:ribosomal protein S18 acetylase RimI-like enzyme
MSDLPSIEPEHDLPSHALAAVEEGLHRYRREVTGHHDRKGLVFVMRDADSHIIAAAVGHSWGGIAELGQMWVHEDYRGRGYGRALLLAFVEEAKRRGVKRVWLASYDFQAPAMYEKFGFRRIAEFAGWPEGHTNVLLCREFGAS